MCLFVFISVFLSATSLLNNIRGTETEEESAKIFHRQVLQGKLRAAVRRVTEREISGTLLPSEVDDHTGITVGELM